jgi:hypothetical protein
MPKLSSHIACAATAVALLSVFAFAARAEELEVTYTSSHVGAEIFEFNTLDGSYDGLGADGQGEIIFPLSYDSQGNDSVTFAAPGVESNYPGTIIITCCATGFFDGVDPPIFTGGTTVLTWAPGIYHGGYGTFTVALAPSAPEASTWAMMLTGFGALGFVALRRRGEWNGSASRRRRRSLSRLPSPPQAPKEMAPATTPGSGIR